MTGRLGCSDPVSAPEPSRSWISRSPEGAEDAGLLLAFLSARHDAEPGSFIRDVWELGSQRTWEGVGLRASPDLWMALDTAVGLTGDSLDENIESFALARYFNGTAAGPMPEVTAAMEHTTSTPVAWSGRLDSLPKRVVHNQPVEPYGSAYLKLDVAGSATDRRVSAWFEGEYGVRWSFVALQIDDAGRELSRLSAPRTTGVPRAYLPIELSPKASELVLVATNLSSRLPDADAVDTNQRAFQVTLSEGP